jgi:hypothetical protein
MREWEIRRRARRMGRGNSIRLARFSGSTIHPTKRPGQCAGTLSIRAHRLSSAFLA